MLDWDCLFEKAKAAGCEGWFFLRVLFEFSKILLLSKLENLSFINLGVESSPLSVVVRETFHFFYRRMTCFEKEMLVLSCHEILF